MPPVSGEGATTIGAPSLSARIVNAPRCPSTALTAAWMMRAPPPSPDWSPDLSLGGAMITDSSAAPIRSATGDDSAVGPMRARRPEET